MPPTGTVTFLFTDIKGSHARWERQEAMMRKALALHNSLLERCFAAHDGFVFKTIGDAYCVAFSDASEAVAAAVGVQLALRDVSWEGVAPIMVRTALYTGEATYEGDYFAKPVNRVARLITTSHGGQVVLSSTTVDAIGTSIPNHCSLRDLGFHWLEDVPTKERVFQIEHPGLLSDFPPLRSLVKQPNNLPASITSFVGRRQAIAVIQGLLQGARLVTLTGEGGCGKTRLALEVARGLLGDFKDGVWFVELASITSADRIPDAIAEVVPMEVDAGKHPTLERLKMNLADRSVLLILDTCEHLASGVAQVVHSMLSSSPGLFVLVTSRQPLHLPGEHLWRVPPLAVPDHHRIAGGVDVDGCESVELFRQRAKLHRPQFEITDQNAAKVASICSSLDGIPHAIELAAARIRSLSIDQISERLHDRFSLLKGRDPTSPERQKTLRATLDWSHDLLDEPCQILLRRLSVFQGSFDPGAVQRVCEASPLTSGSCADIVWSLVDSSLVVYDGEAERFRLLRTVLSYAGERLGEAGEEIEFRDRHAEWCLALAESASDSPQKSGQRQWLDRLDIDHDNLRAALRWTVDRETGLRIAVALHRFWLNRGHIEEGRSWMESVMRHIDGAPLPLRAKAYNAQGVLAWAVNEYEIARSNFARSLDIQRELGDRGQIAAMLTNMGVMSGELGDYAAAEECISDSLAIYRETDDRSRLATVLLNLGSIRIDRGEYHLAEEPTREAMRIHLELGDRVSASTALSNLAASAFKVGDLALARSLMLESLDMRFEVGDRRGLAFSFAYLAMLAEQVGKTAISAEFFGATAAALSAAESRLSVSFEKELEEVFNAVQNELGAVAYDAAFAVGRNRSLAESVAIAHEWTRDIAIDQADSPL